jgi:hypothetical protein
MRRVALALLVALVAPGCLSVATLDTGRTVGKGAVEVAGGAAAGGFGQTSLSGSNDTGAPSDDDEGIDDTVSPVVPVVELAATYGLGPRTDVGVRFDTALFGAARLKHQVLGTRTSPLAASVGLEVGASPMALLVGGVGYGYASAPLVVSYHPHEAFAVYAAPRYTVVTAFQALGPPPAADGRGDAAWGVPGLAYGVTYGTRYRLAAEVSHVDDLRSVQLALGVRIRVR